MTRGDWGLAKEWRLAEDGHQHQALSDVLRRRTARSTRCSTSPSEHDLKPDAIDEIHVRIGDAQALMLRNREPKTALEAKFTIEFAMASALIARRVGLKELDDGFVRRDDIVASMKKVRTTTTSERLPDGPFGPDERVNVVLRNGETLVHEPVTHAKGSWQKPLTGAELRQKFLDCASVGLSKKQAVSLFDLLSWLDGFPACVSFRLSRSTD